MTFIALHLERVANLRDLGGLPTGDGRRVARGRIYRSGSLHEMTEGDRRALEARRIHTVVDLRSSWEQGHQPYAWSCGRHLAAPLAADDDVVFIWGSFIKGTLTEAEMLDWWTTTGVFDAPAQFPESMGTVFRALLEAAPGDAVLFHCTGGKDRTGAVAALILRALGATPEAITADFVATNQALASPERLEELAARLNEGRDQPLSPESLFALSGVQAEWLDEMYRRLTLRYGSVEGYLSDALGLSAADLARLREQYLEPAEA
ncbi:MAG: tyrosine-protein phosphatase [Acidimicrobiia bacterium]|nr:tyrosine-protein phosphatase [Acidimicrobiia bacterium]